MKYRTKHRTIGFRRPAGLAAFCGAMIHLASTSAWAQIPTQTAGEDKGIIQWLVALGILLIVVGIAFKNAKRSHLD